MKNNPNGTGELLLQEDDTRKMVVWYGHDDYKTIYSVSGIYLVYSVYSFLEYPVNLRILWFQLSQCCSIINHHE